MIFCLKSQRYCPTRSGRCLRQERVILTEIAFLSIFCGVGLAAAQQNPKIRTALPFPISGSIFVLGFVLLGVSLSHCRPW
jgi:hypothetical protein